MANNVTKEFELYEPMRLWLQQYLENKYKGAKVTTIDSHARTLDTYLEQFGIIDRYPQSVGLDIQIDVLGIIINKGKPNIAFIEAVSDNEASKNRWRAQPFTRPRSPDHPFYFNRCAQLRFPVLRGLHGFRYWR